jgi:hypothetical protein
MKISNKRAILIGGIIMHLINITVDKLPENCGECPFEIEGFCIPKGLFTGQQWVDKWSDKRNKDCPLNKDLKE